MEKKRKKVSPVLRLLGEVWKHWPLFLITQAGTVTYLLLEMVMRTMTGQTLDAAAAGDPSFWKKLALMVAAPLLAAPFHTQTMLTKWRVAQDVETSLRVQVGEKSARLSIPALEEQRSGDIMSHLGSELRSIDNFSGTGLAQVVSQITGFVGTLFFMAAIDVPLTACFVAASLLVFPVNYRLSKPVKNLEETLRRENGRAQQAANESMQAFLTVKSFRLEQLMDARFYRSLKQALAAELRISRVGTAMFAAGYWLGYLPMVFLLVLGARRVADGTLTAGMLLSLTTVSNGFVKLLTGVPDFFLYLQHAAGACKRVYDYLDLPEEEGGSQTRPVEEAPFLSFEHVSFAYPESRLILNDLSFTLQRGEKVALVGESGSGKSTALKLICGFLHPVSGRVTVRGHQVEEWALAPLRSQLAYVTQDSYLFPGSIEDNLHAARNTATREELREVCERAGILAFVEERGWDAQVGEQGIKLSGGERQRLSIARAMLKDAPLLLLDEPTSALDAEAERIVQKSLDRLMENRTALVVAHRLATIRNADRILVLDQGRIAAQGAHEELLESCPLYRSMVEKQVLGGEGI